MARLTDPETKNPILPSDGFDGLRATRHTFIGFEPIMIQYTNGKKPANALIFECSETGSRRRWGYQ
jgi:hypothetical protein